MVIILRSTTRTPISLLLEPPISKVKLVKKKSLTTPEGKIVPNKLPTTPPIIAPQNSPTTIREISLFFIIKFQFLIDNYFSDVLEANK